MNRQLSAQYSELIALIETRASINYWSGDSDGNITKQRIPGVMGTGAGVYSIERPTEYSSEVEGNSKALLSSWSQLPVANWLGP